MKLGVIMKTHCETRCGDGKFFGRVVLKNGVVVKKEREKKVGSKEKRVGSNQIDVELQNGTTVLYSYATPVAAFVPGRGGLCSSTKYSATTSRHVNFAIERWGCSKTVVDQTEIDDIADIRTAQ